MVQGVPGTRQSSQSSLERTGSISTIPGTALGDGKESSGQSKWWAKAQGAEFGELPRVYLME